MDKLLVFLLFGDQSLDTHGFLADFYRREDQGILAKAFLDQAGEALRTEVDRLPRLERSKLPVFRTLRQLNERYHTSALKHSGIDSALLALSQLVDYIDHAEKHYEDVTQHESTYLVGLCSGLFAASAIASTTSVSSLVPLAVQTVLMAFRTGSQVAALAERLEASGDSSESWTYIVPGLTEEAAEAEISEFHSAQGISPANRAWVSATSTANCAISGPPSTLRAFRAASSYASKATSIPVYGPYHAAHLHRAADVESILQLDSPAVVDAFVNTKPRSSVMSCESGTWLDVSSTRALFTSVVTEILTQPLRFRRVLDGCLTQAREFEGKSSLIIPFGPTQHAATLANLLKAETQLEVTLRQAAQISRESQAPVGNHGSTGRCKLAIVGMAGVFPDAADHEKLWDLLCKGLDVHREVPPERFPVATHVDPTGKAVNTSHTPYGCWIENPGMFDPRFFNMSPREAFQTDPMQRMAITTAYKALEMSGYVPNRTPSTRLDRIGTFYGQTSDDWREINAAQAVDTYYITGGVRAFGPGRINYHFGFSGPSLNIDTACSSSAAAMNVACSSLWARDCDTAIVGGLSCMTNSDIFAGLSRGQFLSKKGPCATFDNEADGYCRGDGCASVVVKRLEDAVADNDRVLAVILGTATNHSADAISITHPHGPTQSLLSTAILDDAGVDPLDVDYVEMHGTGTQAGDGTEMRSVTDVFAPANRKRSTDRPLYLGAVKANLGHGEAASGITALCKVLLMLKNDAIPPHVGIKKGSVINKTFPKDLAERNVNIAFQLTPFKRRDGKLRRVFINNFSAAGGNTGLLLEDAPVREPTTQDPRSVHVITITGKSKVSMLKNAERMVEWIEKNPTTPVSHLAYTTTARRQQHYWRMNITASDLEEAKQGLVARLRENYVPVSSEPPKVAFLFTGQGSHYAGLGKELYANHSVFHQSINEFDRIAQIHGFPSFMPLIDGSEPDVSQLSPVVVQLGLACFEMALARLWISWDVKPSAVLGHSLGEYAALHIAGVLSASDAIYLVGARAQLLVEKCTAGTHAMLAVQGAVSIVQDALGDKASTTNVACINGPRETVLSGEAAEMAEIAQQLTASGFKCTQLKVPFAFHSAQVEPILDEFEELARSVRFHLPQVPVISPLLGKLVENEPINAKYLRDHAREAVDFLGGLVSAQQSNTINETTVWIEVGPHPVCSNMVKAAFGASTVAVPTLRRSEPSLYKTLSASLCTLHTAGLKFDWNEYHNDFVSCVRNLDTPAYAFDEKNYWIQYEGDWCITKNRVAKALPPATVVKPKLETTTVHKVLREEVKGDVSIVEIETNLSREDIRGVVTGHLVNGAPLCPSSLYGDMAITVCNYAYKLVKPDVQNLGVNVSRMEVPKTLIFDESLEAHVLRMTATVDTSTNSADLIFYTGEGAKRIDHANCKVFFGNTEEWQGEFDRVSYLIKSRIDSLIEAEKEGKASKVGRGLAYKLFCALVDYNPRYRGMEEVTLDSDTCEATAKVKFQTTEKDGQFVFSPYWIDSLCHISGFIVNGTDAIDSRDQVFISHGWGAFKFTELPVATKEYRSYVRMQPVKGSKVYAGDVYVYDGDKIIGMCGDLKFQCIPRKVLNMMMPPRGAAAVGAPAPRPVAAPKAAAPAKKSKGVTPKTIAKVNQKLVTVVSQVLDILAQEIGVGNDELADNVAFTDLGVDSLMSLSVSGRIREEMDLNIDNHAFVDHPTIGAFKDFLAQFEGPPGACEDSSSSASSESGDMETDSDVTTPADESETSSIKGEKPAAADASSNDLLREEIRNTIAAEMGMDVDEIIAAPDLASLGMDSLMSLQILSTLRERTGIDIAADLFVTNASLKDVERALGISVAPAPVAQAAPAKAPKVKADKVKPLPPTTAIPPSQVTASIAKPPPPKQIIDNYPHRKATSVLLQGSHKTATQHLFMIPDGSGCATSYTEISSVGQDWAVWGLFSPFMKTPEEFTCGVYGMASKFIEEMKRRQPTGPYSMAGWSAGGVIAYEIVNQLTKAGEEVANLIIIDAPCPVTIEPLPRSLHAWFAEIGLLGEGDTKKIPEWLLPHFAASVSALSSYTAEPIPKEKCPKVMAIWCEDGVCHLPTDPRPDPYPTGHALFLLDNRVDFGPNRWDEYLDVNKMTMRHMPGNHFSMMHGELAKQLGSFLREALC